jgi:aspartyl-tRNA(Asn)/glutamyl-tRNA(Gln) amidotransferase subunit A
MTSPDEPTGLSGQVVDDLAFATLEQMSRSLAAKDVSSLELVELHLHRMAKLDPKLHAYAQIFADSALRAAQAADLQRLSGRSLGPLHGIPIAIKDIFEIAGYPTEVGSRSRIGMRSTQTAHAVLRLEAAGMIVLGKTHMVELAFGGWGTNPLLGAPWNPWDLETHRVPGGSSSGSAVAVASGLAPAALGTDTGGSCRTPASFCGVVGLKTSMGLIGRSGVIPLSPTHDTIGPLTRSVRDAALLLDELSAADPDDLSTSNSPRINALADVERGIEGLRIGYLDGADLDGVDPRVRDLIDRALADFAQLGAKLERFVLPRSLDRYLEDAGKIMSAESYAYFREVVEKPDSGIDPVISNRIFKGRAITAADYIASLANRRKAHLELHAAFGQFDAFVAPTCPSTAIPVSAVDENQTTTKYGRFVNFLDLASLSLPIGFTEERLPAGLQVVVRKFDDPLSLRIGRALEKARGGLYRTPPSLQDRDLPSGQDLADGGSSSSRFAVHQAV